MTVEEELHTLEERLVSEELHTLEQRVISLEKLVQGLYRMLRILQPKAAHPHWSDFPR